MATLKALIEEYGSLCAAGDTKAAGLKLAEIDARLSEKDPQLFEQYWAAMAPAFEVGAGASPKFARTIAEIAWGESRNKLVLGADWEPRSIQELLRSKQAASPAS